MRNFSPLILLALFLPFGCHAQTLLQDDFEGNGTITTWYGDDCGLNTSFANPFSQAPNTSGTVLQYDDTGGQYANVGFDWTPNFNLATHYTFSLKIYIPSNGLTGNQPNQISLKLQDGTLGSPWSTQSEVIKSVQLDQWQTVTFDFNSDPYINLDPTSLPPIQRTDFNRVLLQVNGENNTDHVVAYIDDFAYDGSATPAPVFNNLVWSDEFDVDGALDSSKWFHQTQLPAGGSWYNGEIQHYTNRTDNSVVDNGKLLLTAKKETFTDQGYTKQYTSARLNSKFAFTYGRVEIMAKLPTGVGTWPAIWMLGKNITETGAYWQQQGFGTTPWPACGEIDIMEHWGHNQNFVQSAMHTPSSSGNTTNKGGQTISTASTDFHLYALEWTSEKMTFSVDGNVHYIYDPAVKDASTWPYDADQYLLLNIAIEPSIDPAFTGDAMEIDYIRVYQEGGTSIEPVEPAQELAVFPNPVNDVLTLELVPSREQTVTLSLHSLEGKLIKTVTETIENDSVRITELGDLAPGMYLITYELAQDSHRVKFLKN